MRRALLLVVLLSGFTLSAQDRPVSELSRVFFLSEVSGLTATTVNPAGLSIRPDDDGVLVGYDFLRFEDQGNSFASLSMGNLGFSYQDYYKPVNRLRMYSVNLSVGGKSVAVGTSNKLVKGDAEHFAIDVGVLFLPAEFLSIAAVVRNLNEPAVHNHDFGLRYAAGFGLFFLERRIKVFGEAEWQRGATTTSQTFYHAGVGAAPTDFLEFRAGVYNDESRKNRTFFGVNLTAKGSLELLGTVHLDENREVIHYSTMLLIPLRTVSF